MILLKHGKTSPVTLKKDSNMSMQGAAVVLYARTGKTHVKSLPAHPSIPSKNMGLTELLDSVPSQPCHWSAMRQEHGYYNSLTSLSLDYSYGDLTCHRC